MLFILCMPNAFREILHSVEKSICLSLLYFFFLPLMLMNTQDREKFTKEDVLKLDKICLMFEHCEFGLN